MDAITVIAAAMAVSIIGALFYNMLPVYVGSAQDYRGLDNRALGFLTAAFFAGYNLVTLSAFFWIRRISWRLVVTVATPIALLSLYAGTLTESYSILLATVAIAGGAFAALYGVGTTILGDTSHPARWYGVKIALEALPGAVLLFVLPAFVVPKWGFNGVVFGIIATVVLLCPLLLWTPARGSWSAPESEGAQEKCSWHVWAAIAGAFVFFSGASALWAFLERIGVAAGFSGNDIGALLALTLVAATLGSITAALLDGRFGNLRPFMLGVLACLLSLGLLNDAGTLMVYGAGACLATFAIGFLVPVAVTEIAELDTDGRFVVLSVPAIGSGAMAGPAIGGALSVDGSFTTLLIFCALALLVSVVLMSTAAAGPRKQAVLIAS